MNSLELVAQIKNYLGATLLVTKSEGTWWGGRIWSVSPASGSKVSIHFHEEGYEKRVDNKKTPSPPYAFEFDAAHVSEETFHGSGFFLRLPGNTTLFCERQSPSSKL